MTIPAQNWYAFKGCSAIRYGYGTAEQADEYALLFHSCAVELIDTDVSRLRLGRSKLGFSLSKAKRWRDICKARTATYQQRSK